jgi:hypothetical protein
VRQDAIFLLNFLDTLAIGVHQKVYIDKIVEDNLGLIMVDAITKFVDNSLGDFGINRDRLVDLVTFVEEFRKKVPAYRAVP